MKKWFFIIVAFVAICLITFSVTVYTMARQPLHETIEQAERIALEDLQYEAVNTSYIYNGSQSYTVVIGSSEENNSIVAFIPLTSEDQEVETRLMDDGVSAEEVLNMLNSEDAPSKILSTKLGYESIGPVWEVVYLDDEEMLNYYYVSFDNGEWWRTIRNL